MAHPPLTRSQKWRLAGVIVGGILIHLSLGTMYTFGNLSPYLTSYLRESGAAPSLTYTQCSWVFALIAMGQGGSMYFGGLLADKIGLRLSTLIGAWLQSLSVFLTYFSCQHSFAAVVVTYGLMFGLGVGLAYAPPITCAIRWMPHRKGLMSGLIVAGFGGGSFIFDQVQKAYINPNNKEATEEVDGNKYFTQPDILNRVPKMFLVMGGCYSIMQLIGCLLLSDPPQRAGNDQSQHHGKYTEGNGYRGLEEDEEESIPNAGDVQRSASPLQNEITMSPSQMLRTKEFYILYAIFFLMGQGSVMTSTLYKAFGLTFISSDAFLSWTGGFASVINGLGRIFWGLLADRFSIKTALLLMTAMFTCLLLTFMVTSVAGEALFFIYVCLLFGCFSGCFALFPSATSACFGQTQLTKNYGLLFTSQIFTAVIGVFATQKLETAIGWSGLFFYTAGSSFLAFLFAIAFNAKDGNNQPI